MRNITLGIALVFAFMVGFAAVSSTAHEMMSSAGTSDTKDLVGASVENPQGEFLGIITDFVEEPGGRVTFAILNFGRDEDYGDGGRMVAVPFDSLSCAGQDCTLDSTYENLVSSPVFMSKDELTERRLAEDIYRYFGVQPFWTEQEPSKPETAPDNYGPYYNPSVD